MSRIDATFAKLKQQGRKALIPFVTAGDPSPKATVPLMRAMVKAGADMLELGVPFSDPMADGPVIQRASERALKHGVSLSDVLTMAAEFRCKDKTTPVILMGYANPLEAMGYQVFVERAAAAGVDGVLIVDYPPEECEEFVRLAHQRGLSPIFLLSPTSPDSRIERVAKMARGFVYYVSLKGVTGASNLDIGEVRRNVLKLSARLPLPVGVGFGIRDAATAKAVAVFADAVVVGSRIVQEIEQSNAKQRNSRVAALIAEFRQAMDAS